MEKKSKKKDNTGKSWINSMLCEKKYDFHKEVAKIGLRNKEWQMISVVIFQAIYSPSTRDPI